MKIGKHFLTVSMLALCGMIFEIRSDVAKNPDFEALADFFKIPDNLRVHEKKTVKQVVADLKDCLNNCQKDIEKIDQEKADSRDQFFAELKAKQCVRRCISEADEKMKNKPIYAK